MMVPRLRQPIRQGDILLIPTEFPATDSQQNPGKKLPHLTLAKGEATRHSHRILEGEAELYEVEGTLLLRVLSPRVLLDHEEHHALPIPQGTWIIRTQRQYIPQKRPNTSHSSKITHGNSTGDRQKLVQQARQLMDGLNNTASRAKVVQAIHGTGSLQG